MLKKKILKKDDIVNNNCRWNRVFEFKEVKILEVNTLCLNPYNNPQSKNFVLKAWQAFCFIKSQISLEDYRNLLEVLG